MANRYLPDSVPGLHSYSVVSIVRRRLADIDVGST